MKTILLLISLIACSIQSRCQEMKCFCFQKDAPVLFELQTDATKIAEWIVIKNDLVAVISYMDKSCDQPWSFFEENFEAHSRKNRIYHLSEKGDSLFFVKTFTFKVKDQVMKQEYVYHAKIYSDSLKVHIDYPASKNSPTTFNDLVGSPDRKYFRVLRE